MIVLRRASSSALASWASFSCSRSPSPSGCRGRGCRTGYVCSCTPPPAGRISTRHRATGSVPLTLDQFQFRVSLLNYRESRPALQFNGPSAIPTTCITYPKEIEVGRQTLFPAVTLISSFVCLFCVSVCLCVCVSVCLCVCVCGWFFFSSLVVYLDERSSLSSSKD